MRVGERERLCTGEGERERERIDIYMINQKLVVVVVA